MQSVEKDLESEVKSSTKERKTSHNSIAGESMGIGAERPAMHKSLWKGVAALQNKFSIAVLVCVAIYWIVCIVTKSSVIDAYFLRDHHDTGMDYFNMLANMSHDNPWYADANYPAMCFAILRIMFNAIPMSVYEDGIDGFGLRSNMIAQLGYILLLGVCLLAVWEIVKHLGQGRNADKILLAASLIFSGPMFYLIERGNLLLISLPGLLAYYALYDSSQKKLRYVGYVCLALSASVKLYPALFGILVPLKKRYKETIHLLLIGIVVFFLPFFWFNGFGSVLDMFHGFSVASDVMTSHGIGYNFSFNSCLTLIAAAFGCRIVSWPTWTLLVPVALGIWILFVGDQEWKKLYGIALWCIWLPSFSYTYTLTIFFLPLLSFFRDAKEENIITKVYASLFVLLTIPYALPMLPAVDAVLGGELWFFASWVLVVVDCVILIMGLLILIEHYIAPLLIRHTPNYTQKAINKIIKKKKKFYEKRDALEKSGQEQHENCREFWICGILLCVAVLAYHTLYFNSVLPVSEGWGIYYVELLNRGQFPYRDFAYYLPPLNLLIEWVLWKLSFGYMLVFRGWYLLQRLLIVALLYKLMTKWFQPRYVWIACLAGACLGSASVYDLCGDYNQTQTLFIVLLAYLVSKFLDQDGAEKGVYKFRNKRKYIFFSGILLSLMLLLKQSLGLAAIIVCFAFLVAYCLIFHDRAFGQYCAATATGAAIPLLVCCAVLTLNGAFLPFLTQYFGMAGAKGGVGTILLSPLNFVSLNSMILFCIGVLLALVGRKLQAQPGKYNQVVFSLVTCVLVLMVYQTYSGQIIAAAETILNYWQLEMAYVALVLFSIFACTCTVVPNLKRVSAWNYVLPVCALLFAALVCVLINSNFSCSEFFYRTGLFASTAGLLQYFARYLLIAALAYYIFDYRKAERKIFPEAALALFLCALVDIFACNMTSAGDPIQREMFTTIPIFVILLFSYKLPKWDKVKNYIICLSCVFVCFLCMLQKYTGAYNWWGSSEMYFLRDRTETVEIDALAGFRLSEQKALEYEQITRIIQENGDPDSTVWGFPHVKIFNILTNHYNVDDPVPVLFYDVCSDEMAEQEVEWLRQSPPDFVIWCDIPDCIEAHEITFRNGGRLVQRDIIDWFIEAKSNNYVQVGQVGNLFVYQLKDSVPVNYTYIQNPEAKNGTIGEI